MRRCLMPTHGYAGDYHSAPMSLRQVLLDFYFEEVIQ